jgi:ribosomal protein S18 acetylase RimI-like enzyme
MPGPEYFPISHFDEVFLHSLMEEEEKMWMSDLGWDYSAIRHILASLMRQKLLSGYVGIDSQRAIGYVYFLANQAKGIIGSLYASQTAQSQEAVERLISLAISHLRHSKSIQRIESQIMPFHNLNISAAFLRHGFECFPRCYLDLNLDDISENSGASKKSGSCPEDGILPWNSGFLERAAEMTVLSYRNQVDVEICDDYRTKSGCENYLRSLVENPGCGFFLPEASFISLDNRGHLCGILICSRISSRVAMIPQIAVHPSRQERGLGSGLIFRSLKVLKASGFHSVTLMVTKANRRAFDWYRRLGFRIRKEFGGYVWQCRSNYEL